MKNLFTTMLLLAIVLTGVTAFAQSKSIIINGRITSFEESLPLEGVSITVKNSNNSTGTQADGSFSLVVLPEDKTLLFRLDGYETKEIPITKPGDYNVVLKRTGNIVYAARVNGLGPVGPVSGVQQNQLYGKP